MKREPGYDYTESAVVARFEWRLRPHRGRESMLMHELMRDWHRGMLLGLEVEELSIDGRPVDQVALERLNLWVQAGGAWNSRNLPYWDARARIVAVLFGKQEERPTRKRRDDGDQPIIPTVARSAGGESGARDAVRTVRRKNPRGPVSREDAIRWMREIDAEFR